MSIRTIALTLSATLALISAPLTAPSAMAEDAAPAAATAAAFDDSTPEALIASAVKALKGNDVAAFWRRLPAADQQRIQDGWSRTTGNQFFSGMIERRLAQLTGDQLTSAVVPALTGTDAAVLSARLRQFATNIEPAAPAAPDPAQAGGGQPGGFGGRGGPGPGGPLMPWFESVDNELITLTLAGGFETDQTETLTALFSAMADWAAQVPFSDKDKATAFTTELSAAIDAPGLKTAADVTASPSAI